MGTSMNDFLNTVLQMRHVMNETAQVQQQRDSARVSALSSFIQQAQMSQDPQLMTPLIDTYANAGVASREDLLGLLRTIAPTTAALTGYETKQGMMGRNGIPTDQQTPAGSALASDTANAQLTGQNAGQLAGSALLAQLIPHGRTDQSTADQAASRAATGMTRGQSALDTAMANLPAVDQTSMARIQGDLTLGARGDAQNQLGWAQNRLGWAGLMSQSANDQAELGIRAEAAKHAGRSDLTGISAMLTNKAGLIKALTDTKESPPPQVIMGYIGSLNAINQLLDNLGIANEGQIPFDPALMSDPTWLQSIKRRLGGVPAQGASTPRRTPLASTRDTAAVSGAGRGF
jgi:hypothetical protein